MPDAKREPQLLKKQSRFSKNVAVLLRSVPAKIHRSCRFSRWVDSGNGTDGKANSGSHTRLGICN
jgi:hypothetical protein